MLLNPTKCDPRDQSRRRQDPAPTRAATELGHGPRLPRAPTRGALPAAPPVPRALPTPVPPQGTVLARRAGSVGYRVWRGAGPGPHVAQSSQSGVGARARRDARPNWRVLGPGHRGAVSPELWVQVTAPTPAEDPRRKTMRPPGALGSASAAPPASSWTRLQPAPSCYDQ